MTPDQARGNARLAGAVTAVAGPVLLAAPQRVRSLAGVDDDRLLRLVGASDVVLAPGLLLAPGWWPWVAARGVTDVVVGVRLLREPGARAKVAAATLLALAVLDGRSAAALRRTTR